jgi:radical SAM-linked protein
LAYSQGYHPQPRINLASALPLGFTSQAELADIWLEETLPIKQISQALTQALPPGLQIIDILDVALNLPPLQTQVVAAEYLITLLDPVEQLDNRLLDITSAATLPRERRKKTYDLRPLILELTRLPDDAQGHACLCMRLSAGDNATGRPEEVLSALDIAPESARIHRTHLVFRREENQI